MSVFRTVFLGTPDFAKIILNKMLLDEHFEVVGVVTQPDRPRGRNLKLSPCPVKELALEKGIPVLSPESINNPQVLKQIAEWKAEAAVVVAFGQIVSDDFLNLFPRQVVNVHGSLLPHLRGAAPIQRAIMQGDKETGVALQVMVKKLDAGDVLGVRRTPITDDKDALKLHDELALLGAELIEVELVDYLKGNLTPEPQDESKVTYASKIDKSESNIDWSKSAREIFNQIRGLKLGPGTQTTWKQKKLKIHRAQVVNSSKTNLSPGTLTACDKESFTVACGGGTELQILEVQPESKPKMPVGDFIRGHKLTKGDYLGE